MWRNFATLEALLRWKKRVRRLKTCSSVSHTRKILVGQLTCRSKTVSSALESSFLSKDKSRLLTFASIDLVNTTWWQWQSRPRACVRSQLSTPLCIAIDATEDSRWSMKTRWAGLSVCIDTNLSSRSTVIWNPRLILSRPHFTDCTTMWRSIKRRSKR